MILLSAASPETDMPCHVTTRVINHILSEEVLVVTKKVEQVLGLLMFRKKTPVTNRPLKVTWDLGFVINDVNDVNDVDDVNDDGYMAESESSNEDTIEDPEYQDPVFLLGMHIKNL